MGHKKDTAGNEEVASRELEVDRTFAAQDFLILGLQSLNYELDAQKHNVQHEAKPPRSKPARTLASQPTPQLGLRRSHSGELSTGPSVCKELTMMGHASMKELPGFRRTPNPNPTVATRAPDVESRKNPTAATRAPDVESRENLTVATRASDVESRKKNTVGARAPDVESRKKPTAGARAPDVESHKERDFDDVAWEKTEPYRNIIAVLEQRVASKEQMEVQLQHTEIQLQKVLEENQIANADMDEFRSIMEESELSWAQELKAESSAKDEVARELEIAHGLLNATVANRDCALQQADARVEDMKSEVGRLTDELLQVHESSTERYRILHESSTERYRALHETSTERNRTLECNFREQASTLAAVLEEGKQKEEALHLRVKAEQLAAREARELVAEMKKEVVQLSSENSELHARTKELDGDLTDMGMMQTRLYDARRQSRRSQGELESERAQFEEFRVTLEKQLAKEREYAKQWEEKENECRSELNRSRGHIGQNEVLNQTLTRESEVLEQKCAIMEQRVKLNGTLEERLAEKNAEILQMQADYAAMQQKFEQEVQRTMTDQKQLLAVEQRNAALVAELRSAEQVCKRPLQIHGQVNPPDPQGGRSKLLDKSLQPHGQVTPPDPPAGRSKPTDRSLQPRGHISPESTPAEPQANMDPGVREELEKRSGRLHERVVEPSKLRPTWVDRLSQPRPGSNVADSQSDVQMLSRSQGQNDHPARTTTLSASRSQPKIAFQPWPRSASSASLRKSAVSDRYDERSVSSLSVLKDPQRLAAHMSPNLDRHRTPKQQRKRMTSDLVELVGEIQDHIAMYVPVKNDMVDQHLAHLINTYQPPVPFFRLQAGVYLFGSRKVMVKIVTGKKLVFRVGGGFCSFHEFLDQFACEELEKMEQEHAGKDHLASREGSESATARSDSLRITERLAEPSTSSYATSDRARSDR